MKTTKKKGFRIALIVLAVLVVLACALLLLAGNFLVDFALNPNGSFTMQHLFEMGSDAPAEENPAPTPKLSQETLEWRDYTAAAWDWFAREGQEAFLTSEDGLLLHGWSFPREDSHRYAIVCHGYSSAPAHMAGYIRKFYDMGCSVLAPAARGHEASQGEYYGMGWPERRDIVGWINQIVAADPDAEIVLFGISMGGATVMMTAGEELPANVKCIVEDCGYSSVWDEFSVQLHDLFGLPNFPLLHVSQLVCRFKAGYTFKEASSVEQLKKAEVPMLFIHGEDDTFVPYSMLDPVYEACASKEKIKLTVPGAAHGAAADTDPTLYWSSVESFLDSYLN